jgi:hypothetical protein
MFMEAVLIALYIGRPQPKGPTAEELAELDAFEKKSK